MERKNVNILVVDDHALFREGLKMLLKTLEPGVAIEEAGSCAQALERARASRYDLVLLDLKMPGVHGLDALAAIREAVPDAPVVVLSGEDDPRLVRATIERGAMGFIPKSSTPEVLHQALQLVLARGIYLPMTVLDSSASAAEPERQAAPAAEVATLPGLTPRQMDVLRCVIQGKPNKVIARELDVAEATVKVHLSSVLRALGVHNRTEAVYAAAKLGLRLV